MLFKLNMKDHSVTHDKFDRILTASDGSVIYLAGEIKGVFGDDCVCQETCPEEILQIVSSASQNNKLLSRLFGEYILIFDKGRKLEIVSDMSAIKEAYWHLTRDELIVCDDFLDLIKLVKYVEHDPEEVSFFLKHGYCRPGKTLFKNIQRLPSGKIMHIEDDFLVENYLGFHKPSEVNYGAFKKALESAIRSTMSISRVDREVVALSGGIDSSVILGVVKKFGTNVNALTIHYNPAMALNERDVVRADRITKNLGVEHEIVQVDFNEIDPSVLLPIVKLMPLSVHPSLHLLKMFELLSLEKKQIRVWSGQNLDSLYHLGPSSRFYVLHRFLISNPYVRSLDGSVGYKKWILVKKIVDLIIRKAITSKHFSRYLAVETQDYARMPNNVDELVEYFNNSERYLAVSTDSNITPLPRTGHLRHHKDIVKELFDSKLATFLTGGDPRIFYTVSHIYNVKVSLPYSNGNMVQIFRNLNRGWMDIWFPKRFLYRYAREELSIPRSFYDNRIDTKAFPDVLTWEIKLLRNTEFGRILLEKVRNTITELRVSGTEALDPEKASLPLEYALRLYWIDAIYRFVESHGIRMLRAGEVDRVHD